MLRNALLRNTLLRNTLLRNTPLRNTLLAATICVASAGSLGAADTQDQRREQVEKMTPAEKEELQQKFEKFLALSSDEQDKLRQLDAQLNSDPQGDRLRRVMQRYYDWLKTLSPADRADLLALPPDKRIAGIKKLKHEQEARLATLVGGSVLTAKDVQTLYHWMEEIAMAHEEEILKELPAARRDELKTMDAASRRKALMFIAWQRGRPGSTPKISTVSDEQLKELSDELSAAPRKTLDDAPDSQQRLHIVRDWVQSLVRARFASQRIGKFGAGVSQEELTRFFYQDLSKEDRDRLMGLSREEMRRELWRLYLQRKRTGEPRVPGEGPPHFGEPNGSGPDIFPKGKHPGIEPVPPPEEPSAFPPKLPSAGKDDHPPG